MTGPKARTVRPSPRKPAGKARASTTARWALEEHQPSRSSRSILSLPRFTPPSGSLEIGACLQGGCPRAWWPPSCPSAPPRGSVWARGGVWACPRLPAGRILGASKDE